MAVGGEGVGFVGTCRKYIDAREGTPTPTYRLLLCRPFSARQREFDRIRKLISYLFPAVVDISHL